MTTRRLASVGSPRAYPSGGGRTGRRLSAAVRARGGAGPRARRGPTRSPRSQWGSDRQIPAGRGRFRCRFGRDEGAGVAPHALRWSARMSRRWSASAGCGSSARTRRSACPAPASWRSAHAFTRPTSRVQKTKAPYANVRGFRVGTLAATYSDMAYGHTTIGAERFHFRVRNGIGWFPFAMTARETCSTKGYHARRRNSEFVKTL